MISLRALADCLFLPANFSVRGDLLGWLSPPPSVWVREQLGDLYCYKRAGVPDVDQRWDGLPNQGAEFCVPTSSMNWLYYVGAPPDPGIAAATILNLAQLANMMDTDPDDGTGFEDGMDGLSEWLDGYGTPALIIGATVSDGASVRIDHLRGWADFGGLVNVNMGRYVESDGELERESGHRMTMVGLHHVSARAEIVVHDPNDEGADLTTQSPTREVKAALADGEWNIEGDVTTLVRWGTLTDKYRLVDGYVVVIPVFALTNPEANTLTLYQAQWKSQEIRSKSFELPFTGELADLALHPRLPWAAVLGQGKNGVWLLDLATGAWREVARMRAPVRLTFGGRAHQLFVANERGVTSVDVETGATRSVDQPLRVDAITYDPASNLLVAASVERMRILSLTPALSLQSEQDISDFALRDLPSNTALAVDPRDGVVVLTSHVSDDTATVHRSRAVIGSGTPRRERGITRPWPATGRGILYASERGRVSAFDFEGNRVEGAVFAGLPAGSLLQVARSNDNFDPRRAQVRGWRDGRAGLGKARPGAT